MQNKFVFFSNTIGEYELFIKNRVFYWPRNLTKLTSYQRKNSGCDEEKRGDTVYIVTGSKIKNSIQDPALKKHITTSPMVTHKGIITEVFNYPLLGYRFIPRAYHSYKKPENYCVTIPLKALSNLKNLDQYLGKPLTFEDKQEIEIAINLQSIFEQLYNEGLIEFEHCYLHNNTWYITNQKENKYTILDPSLSQIDTLPKDFPIRQDYCALPNKQSLERIIKKCYEWGFDGPNLVGKLGTWAAENFLRIEIEEDLFCPLEGFKLVQGVSTRQILDEDHTDILLNEIKKRIASGKSSIND